MNFEQVLDQLFLSTCTEPEFVGRTHAALARLGFKADNSIASACLC
jgi:hypothetical protein